MDATDLNYFTCTLGQSVLWKQQQQQQQQGIETTFETVLELIDTQARDSPESPALGFADFTATTKSYAKLFITFGELTLLSKIAARVLQRTVGSCPVTIGLICPSSLEFVLTWLGLMRLGHTVLLLAPQLDSAAIKHLCEQVGVKTIFLGKAQQHILLQEINGISFEMIPDYDQEKETSHETPKERPPSDVAYLRHTSGTSSGLPKLIIQKHWGAVGVLPRLTGQEHLATFTTTPLYHGGLADCFRSWAAGAMTWFFPEGVVPVTETNVIKAVLYAHENSKGIVRIAYFTSVPFVLQDIAANTRGLKLLQAMDLVGVGGAALAPSVGDELVRENVRLVSRMGSAECGFLMSSHRDYELDKEWQYLRPVLDENLMSFEPRDAGLFELVAKPGWPLRASQNREDGSYETSDLFQPHGQLLNAWRYHSRADAQITLANGKKFDPAPLEGMILASSRLLKDVFIFGTGRDYAGALLFPEFRDASSEDVLASVWPVIECVNKDSPSHARLAKTSLVVVPNNGCESVLEKSSKGTIMRRQTETRYADRIKSAYAIITGDDSRHGALGQEEVRTVIIEKFSEILGRAVSPTEDLFRQGVDSITCIQVRKLIETSLLPFASNLLPRNIIYEQGSIERLSNYICNVRRGIDATEPPHSSHEGDSELELMMRWAEIYGDFSSLPVAAAKRGQKQTVILTGATGALGAHVLQILREDPKVDQIYCLVRGQTPLDAHNRVSKGLGKREIPDLNDPITLQNYGNKVVCLPINLLDDKLGLSDEVLHQMSWQPTLVIHAAWTVNFSLQLKSFEDHLRGLNKIVRFAISAGSDVLFVSSTASIGASPQARITEAPSWDPSDASALGYSRSKWVAEKICAAADHYCISQRGAVEQGPRVSIVRVGQLCGNHAGIWNESEGYPLMLSTAKITGSLPDLQDESLNWLPVDQAARAVLEVASWPADVPESDSVLIRHVLNRHKQPRWREMLKWLQESDSQNPFEVVPPAEWMARLERVLDGGDTRHPSQKLLDFWQRKYGNKSPTNASKEAAQKPVFDVSKTSLASKTIAQVQPLSRDQIVKMWHWVCNNVGGCSPKSHEHEHEHEHEHD